MLHEAHILKHSSKKKKIRLKCSFENACTQEKLSFEIVQ